MDLLHSPDQYLYNLHTTSSAEAKRMWRQQIREKWEYKCAYCGSEEKLTIDHIVPQSKGGMDFTKNVVCCCHSCNQDKGHTPWEDWYFSQEFFSMEKYEKIKNWMKPDPPVNLFAYRPRRNYGGYK
jgi:CRISPR/Cas system Type II protein with McrA/HNH and RuvC-like nuclease domain